MLGSTAAGSSTPQWVDNGPGWVGGAAADADAVLALRPGFVDLDVGVVGPAPGRLAGGVRGPRVLPEGRRRVEDPVTGSLNASLAQWLLAHRPGCSAPYVASQGTALGRAGRVHVTQDDAATIWVGGGTVTCVRGEVEL